jgi:hypothetical protein
MVPRSQGVVLGCIIAVQTVASVLFWMSLATTMLPGVVTIVCGSVLGVLWVVNVYRAHLSPELFEGSTTSTLYYNVVRLFSVVSFVFVVPLWGRSRAVFRYGKWVLIVAQAVSVFVLVTIFIVAEPYWEAWGCYGGHVPATLKYQQYGICGSAPIHNVGNIPICHMLGGRDHADPTQVVFGSCDERSDTILAPFRHAIKWCLHVLFVTYSAYVVETLRGQTPHGLHIAAKRAADALLSKL